MPARPSQERVDLATLRTELARHSFLAFVLATTPDFLVGWYHKIICQELDNFLRDVIEKKSPRLMLTMPPRHSKSQLASRCFPAYALGRYPDLSIIATSYGADLASRMNRDVQRIIDSEEYGRIFPGTSLSGHNVRTVADGSYLRNSDIFEVVGHKGVYRSAGVGGGITGMGAECVTEGTLIATPHGMRRIEEIIPGEEVFSFNHVTGQIETDFVLATQERYAEKIYRLCDTFGRVLELTGNHPVFARGEYSPTHSIAEGDSLLCMVWDRLCEACICGDKGPAQGLQGTLLLQGACVCAPCYQKQQAVSGVRPDYQTNRENQGGEDLPGMRKRLPQGTAAASVSADREDLPDMQQGLLGASQRARGLCEILREAVRRDSTLSPNDRQGQLKFSARPLSCAGANEQQSGIPENEATDIEPGRTRLCSLRGGKLPSGSAPYQLEPHRQLRHEPCYSVQSLPQTCAPYTEGSLYEGRVSSVTRLYKSNTRVFDLQIARNQNFFANGILVHNCAIIDDPIKSHAEADSPTIRQGIWDWYTSTLYTRLAPGGGIILILTRWHQLDLGGALLRAETEAQGDKWRVINFPAIAEQDEYWDGKLVRRAGEALHPDRYPIENLTAIRQAIGPRDWLALYQQQPVPDGGAIFRDEWLRHWLPNTLPKKFDALITAWDMSFKEGIDKDFVVGQVWGRAGADLFLLDQFRERCGFTRTVHAFKALAAKWSMIRRHVVEDKANGPAVIDSLKHEIHGIVPCQPDGSKIARAHAVTTHFESGNVHIPDPSLYPWVKPYVAELLAFPSGAHDDQVDATVYGIRDLTSHFTQFNINPAILRKPMDLSPPRRRIF